MEGDSTRRPVVASYCNTFLKPEMLHIYRQVTGLKRFRTFVVTKSRQSEDRFPFDEVEMAPKARSNFLRRFWLKYVKREPPIVYRGEYGVLNRILERRKAEMMHVYFGHTGVHLLPFIQRWPRPVVVSFHGMDVQPRENQPGYLDKLRELLQSATLVMARSESLRDRLIALDCPEDRVRLNRTGIPMEKFPEVERDVPEDGAWRLVQACRLIEKKGLDVTLKAFARLREAFPNARLTIAGEGPLEATVRALASDLGVAGAVSFAGFLSEEGLVRLYSESHVFVHPSQLTADQNQEGVPNSMLEAMATGLPVVATLHGGIPEAVTDGKSGLLVPERDVDGLTEALLNVTGDAALRSRLGRTAASDVRDRFGSDAQIANLETIYKEAMTHG